MRREAGSGKDATSVEVAFELTLKVLEINDATDQSFAGTLDLISQFGIAPY